MITPPITDEERKLQVEMYQEFREYDRALKEYKYMRAAAILAHLADMIADFARDKPEFNQ